MAINLPLDRIVNVSVSVAAQQATEPTFNQGCIIGNSGVIPSVGANSRIRPYASPGALLSDGFSITNPEYLAAQLYFGQSPAPSTLWVGCQDTTAVGAVNPTSASQGINYVIGDVLTLAGSGATVQVTTLGTNGAVTGVNLLSGGTGATITTGIATSGGSGTGCQCDVTALGESAAVAAAACRAASANWYAFMVCGAADADHLACAAFAQSAAPQSVYMGSTADTAVQAGIANNILLQMQALNYNRALMIYSTTQSGLFPSNAYAAAAVIGIAMGLNTGLGNSYFTLKFKQLSGVAIEPLTLAQATNIENAGGNVFVAYPGYTFFEQGTMSNGQFFDQILGIDMLAADIQILVVNALAAQPAIPQTDAGQAILLAAVNRACAQSALIGFIATGTWEGPAVLALATGTPLPTGYSVQSQPYNQQNSADRAARKAMPIYVCVTEAGAAHSVAIQVNVQD
jgi:hypothetical protein